MTTGVPQGTVIGPLLFNAYIAPLTTLLQRHNIRHQLYVDDTQLYFTFPPTDHTQALARMEACVQDAKAWLCDNGLEMNDNKSQAIVIRSSWLHTPTSLTRVNILCGQLVDTFPVIWDLGFTIDINLTMTSQVANVCRSAYYHLSRIVKIRDSSSTTLCTSLIHGLVTSPIDYGNAILFGITDRHLHRLEMVQRSAARIVMQTRRRDRQSMTTILRQLHWLPVRKRIDYKLLVLVPRALYDGTSEYLAALLLQHAPRRSLRSAGGLLLEVPRVNLERFGRRAFACAGLWNKLPRCTSDNGNLAQFKKQ